MKGFMYKIFKTTRYHQPICITDLIFLPEISIRNLDKISYVYPRSTTVPVRFYSAYKVRIGWWKVWFFGDSPRLWVRNVKYLDIRIFMD